MGIPRKSSRRIVVDGKAYSWMARPDEVYDDDGLVRDERVRITFQEDVAKPGPPVQCTIRGRTATPADVAELIRRESNSR
jgi:type IV secretory pathway ATPase VirB11/archaellum biosynthesis ATPase